MPYGNIRESQNHGSGLGLAIALEIARLLGVPFPFRASQGKEHHTGGVEISATPSLDVTYNARIRSNSAILALIKSRYRSAWPGPL